LLININIFLVITSCSSDNDNEPEPLLDCFPISFKETYLENFPKDDVFFIKGVALDTYEYGRNIKLVDDLKGNFTDKSLTFFIWGDGYPSGKSGFVDLESDRVDYITKYQKNDTLIMFIKKAYKRFERVYRHL
jgi:hypothetical protein